MANNLQIQAKADGSPKVTGTAYTGGKLRQWWAEYPIVVDLAGMQIPESVPLLEGHINAAESRLGVVSATKTAKGVDIAGEITAETAVAKEIAAQGKKGADWQLSIGADFQAAEIVEDGESRNINGQLHAPPFYHITASELTEISVVPVGADHATRMRIAASATLTRPTHKNPGVQTMTVKPAPETEPVQAEQQPPVDIKAIAAKAAEDERARVVAIAGVCKGECPEIEAKAVVEGWDVAKTSDAVLAAIRANRPSAPNVVVKDNQPGNPAVLASALDLALGTPPDSVVQAHGEKSVEAAQGHYRRGIGLQELIVAAAAENGCGHHTFRGHEAEIIQAAFSTASLPGILSTAANKRILRAWAFVEQAWTLIAARRNVIDFREAPGYRLSTGLVFEEVGADGEIKHGTVGENSYGNKAKTYARMLSITREMLRNDDMGALDQLLGQFGRGAALKLNQMFWAEFADNATFYTAARGNYAGGADTALGIDSLTAARVLFGRQTDAEGNKLGAQPRFLVCPVNLEVAAGKLFNDAQVLISGSTDRMVTSGNPHTGRYTPVSTAYLDDTTAWYLLADYNDVPVIEVAFLDGIERPTIETAAADFNTLGIQMRGYFDFGVRKQEYRAGVKMSGTTEATA